MNLKSSESPVISGAFVIEAVRYICGMETTTQVRINIPIGSVRCVTVTDFSYCYLTIEADKLLVRKIKYASTEGDWDDVAQAVIEEQEMFTKRSDETLISAVTGFAIEWSNYYQAWKVTIKFRGEDWHSLIPEERAARQFLNEVKALLLPRIS